MIPSKCETWDVLVQQNAWAGGWQEWKDYVRLLTTRQ